MTSSESDSLAHARTKLTGSTALSTSSSYDLRSSHVSRIVTRSGGKKNGDKGKNSQPSSSKNPKDFKSTTGEGLQRSRIGTAYGRVSKEHLASAVRKHFNNTAISEQDAIAKFVYKVSEERKGREFRYRFQPS
ncbi:hypothetical protein CIHG_01901 [Coccidioides immitis H538.4]|uniref:Histone deacetylase complex subunit SAP30 Sin3 binding domain-containing protein n=1 Tax=Coccidioides immitis H538.4 TaxID=396776 RepID=A0A0J8RFZ9_COCIT|nr:hypothetical protein CIHG_01901 [Coccidioides immitis H538.4]